MSNFLKKTNFAKKDLNIEQPKTEETVAIKPKLGGGLKSPIKSSTLGKPGSLLKKKAEPKELDLEAEGTPKEEVKPAKKPLLGKKGTLKTTSIKKEENRRHFANVDKTSEKEFKNAYEDRMTDVTELEESYVDALAGSGYDIIGADFTDNGNQFVISLNHNISDLEEAANELSMYLAEIGIYVTDWNSNGSNVIIFNLDTKVEDAFNLTFEDYNVYGEKLTEAKENFCCICGEPIEGYGNNPEPFMDADNGQCCDGCNLKFVIPARLELMKEE